MNYEKNFIKLKESAKKTMIAQDFTKVQKPMHIYDGFIGSQTLIKPYTNSSLGFYLDDESFYENFLNSLNSTAIHSLGVDIDLIQNALDDYFVGGTKEVEEVCKSVLVQGRLIHSIKDYKNKGGQCIHKASLGANLLLIAGYNAKVVWSNVGSENHAFIIIEDDDKYYIFDPSNHSKMITEVGTHKVPTVVEKSPKDIESFYNGLAPLEITDADEQTKNQKQSTNIKITLPRIRYETRREKVLISLRRNEIDKYVDSLREKGLSDEEIRNILHKIQRDITLGNIAPKVESLRPVYAAIAQEDNLETYFGR